MQGIDIIRLSEKQKQQLIVLKRKTGIENWNVLCRWALCMSLADPTIPPKEDIPSDSNVEMTWKTFSGAEDNIYRSLLLYRHRNDAIQKELAETFKTHLSRGIKILMQSTQF